MQSDYNHLKNVYANVPKAQPSPHRNSGGKSLEHSRSKIISKLKLNSQLRNKSTDMINAPKNATKVLNLPEINNSAIIPLNKGQWSVANKNSKKFISLKENTAL